MDGLIASRRHVAGIRLAGCLVGVLAGAATALSASVGETARGGPLQHLHAFQSIAEANGGNRAAGTPGYDRSAAYVADLLQQAGYAVRLEEFSFPFFRERTPPVLTAGTGNAPVPREALRTLANSGSGDVTAPLQAVDLGTGDDPAPSTSGCEKEDFAAFQVGRIALIRRGTCPFQAKVDHAAAAGAAAVVIMNQGTGGDTGPFSGRLSQPAAIPVIGVSTEAGRSLEASAASGPVRVAVDVESGTRSTLNVIADRAGREETLVVVGAHLDSVPEGPGMNDNGSGSAAVLAAALRLAGEPLQTSLRFAFWGAEERGLIGSRHHVAALSDEERRRIAVYVNLDMVGSLNFGRFIQASPDADAGLAAVMRQSLLGFFHDRGIPVEDRARNRRGSGSDDASFAEKGIPTVGLYTGAGERKGEAQAQRFGGAAGQPYDPCYHKACDTVANVDQAVLEQMTRALLHGLTQAVVGPPMPATKSQTPESGG